MYFIARRETDRDFVLYFDGIPPFRTKEKKNLRFLFTPFVADVTKHNYFEVYDGLIVGAYT